ncbi:MAG: DEAD/DEAH box helicase [Rhizobium sp.]|nr:MAG: DEAD/DEAH box helicase [Rhizobium sp.]
MKRVYGTLTLTGGKWSMDGVPPHVSIRVKHLFPKIPKTATAPFSFDDTQQNCSDLSWFMQRYPLRMSKGDAIRLGRGRAAFEADQDRMEAILAPSYVPNPSRGLREGQRLREYQGVAVDLCALRKRLLLGDGLGLGKTYTSIALALLDGALPAAVVVQGHLQSQWAEKIAEFSTLTSHLIDTTTPYSLPSADVYIFRYSQVRGWVDYFAAHPFATVIFDEAQELRTGVASAKGVAANKLADAASFVLGLTATPIINWADEIWNIMRIIDKSVLGSWEDFSREWMADGRRLKDPDAFGAYLREQHVFLRRTKRDVGQQMPQVNHITEIIPCDHDELSKIEDLAVELSLKALAGRFEERGQAMRELDMMVRHATGVSKAKPVAAYVRVLLEANIPVILVGWHRDVYDVWMAELAEFKPALYSGSESPRMKDESKRRFVEGETNLFIMSLRSGAGLDGLQYRCSTVVFGELDWSIEIHNQVIGRVDREGQEEGVTAVYLNSNGGSDPPIVDILGLKAAQSSRVVDPGMSYGRQHSDTSGMRALAVEYLRKRGITVPAAAQSDGESGPAANERPPLPALAPECSEAAA